MMSVKITDSYSSITDDEIILLEEELNINIPSEYKEFLKKYNSGTPSLHDYKVNDEYFDDIGWFFGIKGYASSHDIKTENNNIKGMLSDHYLAIGVSYGGNLLCLGLKKNAVGSIYRWDHETANYDGEPWEENMTKITSNLDDFLNMLYTES